MKTRLLEVKQEGSSDNGKVIAKVAGSGFTKAEFEAMLNHLKVEARCGNLVDILSDIGVGQVKITFVLKGGDNSEVMTAMLAEMYLDTWCRYRDRAQAC